MSQEPKMMKFDLGQYESIVLTDLNSHLAEITSFLRSTFMAVENFSPTKKNVTILPAVLAKPSEMQSKNEIMPDTLRIAARFSVIGSISAVEKFLRDAWLPLRTADKVSSKNQQHLYLDWKQTWEDESKVLMKNFTFGKLIKEIPSSIRKSNPSLIPTPWDIEEKFEKYNKLRNCIAHRLGYVSELDFSKDETLEVEWNELCFYANNKPLKSLPFLIEEGGQLKCKNEKRTKVFHLDERFDVTPSDAQGIAFDLMLSCKKLIEPIITTTQGIMNKDKTNNE